MGYRTEMQSISAGNQFDGTAPSGTPTVDNDKKSYPEAAAGGLFDFGHSTPQHVVGIELYADGASDLDCSAWSVKKVTAEADEFVVFSGTTEEEFVMRRESRFLLRENEKIKVETTGASVAMHCMVSIDRDMDSGTHG
jgi:hypothetical protein